MISLIIHLVALGVLVFFGSQADDLEEKLTPQKVESSQETEVGSDILIAPSQAPGERAPPPQKPET